MSSPAAGAEDRKHPHERGEDSVILLDFITQKIGSILVANELQAIQ